MTRIGLVPGCLALLPASASLLDPVAELRTACVDLVGWLGEDVRVVAADAERCVAEALLAGRRTASGGAEPSYLVVANGSASRGDRAPGHLDPRAFGYDETLREALGRADADALRRLDLVVGRELLAEVSTLPALADLLDDLVDGQRWDVCVDYDGDPYGVQYWVARWSTAGPAHPAPGSVGA